MKILEMSETLDFEKKNFKNKIAAYLNQEKMEHKKNSFKKHLSGNASFPIVNLTKPEHFYGLETPNANDAKVNQMDMSGDEIGRAHV